MSKTPQQHTEAINNAPDGAAKNQAMQDAANDGYSSRTIDTEFGKGTQVGHTNENGDFVPDHGQVVTREPTDLSGGYTERTTNVEYKDGKPVKVDSRETGQLQKNAETGELERVDTDPTGKAPEPTDPTPQKSEPRAESEPTPEEESPEPNDSPDPEEETSDEDPKETGEKTECDAWCKLKSAAWGFVKGAVVGFGIAAGMAAIAAASPVVATIVGIGLLGWGVWGAIQTIADWENKSTQEQYEIGGGIVGGFIGAGIFGMVRKPTSIPPKGAKGKPKPAKNFKPPTNPPQQPTIPGGYVKIPGSKGGYIYRVPGTNGNGNTIRVMPPTKQYPNGYWRQYNSSGQPINPATGKPGPGFETHVPLPPGGFNSHI